MSDTVIPSTLEEYIDSIEDMDISYRKLHLPAAIYTPKRNKISVIPLTSLFNKYRNVLDNIIIIIELDDEEQAKYIYKPKLVSEELYGSAEFWDVILVLNGCKSVMEFKPKALKIYDPKELKKYINEIMILEEIE